MSYKLTFKGDQKPEIVSDAQGVLMYNDWQSDAMPDRIEIRPGLTVESKSIKRIEHIVDEVKRQNFNPQELRDFDVALTQYLDDRGQLPLHNQIAFLVACQLITVHTHQSPILTNSDATIYVRVDRVNDYTLAIEKIAAWKEWKNRKNYAAAQSAKAALDTQ